MELGIQQLSTFVSDEQEIYLHTKLQALDAANCVTNKARQRFYLFLFAFFSHSIFYLKQRKNEDTKQSPTNTSTD